jgi:hypothetical protein
MNDIQLTKEQFEKIDLVLNGDTDIFDMPEDITALIEADTDGRLITVVTAGNDLVAQAGAWRVNRLYYHITKKPLNNQDGVLEGTKDLSNFFCNL